MCYNTYIVKTNEVNNLDRKKTIEIKCKGADTLPIDRIVEFQGELKKLSKENENKLRNSILKFGFIAPFFVWDDHGELKLLDGHQRLKTLLKMRKEGYDIPPLPVDYIEADSEEDAKRKLLHITSQYGEFTVEGFENFIGDYDIDLGDYNIDIDLKKKEEISPQVEFSEELFEEHNYVVLYFDNDMDWLHAQTFFGLETKAAKRANGKEWSRGIGRVVDGTKFIRKMQE